MASRFVKWHEKKLGNLCVWTAKAGGIVATISTQQHSYARYQWSVATHARDGRFLRLLGEGEARSLEASKKQVDTLVRGLVQRGMLAAG